MISISPFFLLFQLQMPSFALVEGDVRRGPQNNREFDYVVRGRLKIERQECHVSKQLRSSVQSQRAGFKGALSPSAFNAAQRNFGHNSSLFSSQTSVQIKDSQISGGGLTLIPFFVYLA